MNQELQSILVKNGHRNTRAQQRVLSYLKQAAPISINELRLAVSDDVPTTTLYRTLNSFRRLGIAKDVVINGQRKIELTDVFSPHHHHISCKQCGETIDIRDDQLERYLQQLATKRGYSNPQHSFEISGICPKCSS